jgi:sec-independent protein translocase protein TatA
MFGLGMGEGLIILSVVVLLFGGKKLPQLGAALGKSIKNFKSGLNEEKEKTEEKVEDKTKDKTEDQ